MAEDRWWLLCLQRPLCYCQWTVIIHWPGHHLAVKNVQLQSLADIHCSAPISFHSNLPLVIPNKINLSIPTNTSYPANGIHLFPLVSDGQFLQIYNDEVTSQEPVSKWYKKKTFIWLKAVHFECMNNNYNLKSKTKMCLRQWWWLICQSRHNGPFFNW